MTPFDYSKICPGVRDLVRRLRAAGFDTCDSGDGSHHAAGMECAREYPHVTMIVAPESAMAETRRLRDLVRSWGVMIWPIGTVDDYGRSAPSIQLSYDPALWERPGAATLELMHVTDAALHAAAGTGAR